AMVQDSYEGKWWRVVGSSGNGGERAGSKEVGVTEKAPGVAV
nr:hypothetical protein [Tanacetum cinerariifolium]